MKKCLIAGNDPQYVTGLGKEEHIKKLKALLKKYIQRLICCGFTEFCADAESEVAGAAAEERAMGGSLSGAGGGVRAPRALAAAEEREGRRG